MSTHTVGTEAGSRLPVATACSVEATRRASPTSGTAARMAACARMESVITPGKGPSSLIVPAMTTSTPVRMQAAMMPLLMTPVSTAARILPIARIRLMVRK